LAISTKVLQSSAFFKLDRLDPYYLETKIEALNQRTGKLMERVLLCQNVKSFGPVLADIDIVLSQIEVISEASQSLSGRFIGRFTRVGLFESINVLFTNIYLVRHHGQRLSEFAELSWQMDQLNKKIILDHRHRDSYLFHADEEFTRKFKELDVSFIAIKAGLAIRPLIGCQQEYFAALEEKHKTLNLYIKDF